jgi:hypothetical protein
MDTSEPTFPNITRRKAFDRQQHIQKSLEMGMTREEAEKHADADLADREEAERTPPTEGPL